MPFEMVDDLADVEQRPPFRWSHHTGAAQQHGHYHQGRHGGCLHGRHLHLGMDPKADGCKDNGCAGS